jgi:SAM-dependent methyltransferase
VEATEIEKLAAVEDRHWWYAERRHLLASMLRRHYPTGGSGRLAVDVGAAAGGNTRLLRGMGFTAVASEYDPGGAALAKSRGLLSLRADARALPFRDSSVELVVAFDLLEHIEDDVGTLREFNRVLVPGGQLFVAVPCDMRLWSQHDVAVDHVRRYEWEELSHKTRAVGFEITTMRSWNVLLRPLVAIRRKRSSGSDLHDMNRVLNATLRAIVALERPLTRVGLGRSPGVSILMTARRGST